MTVPGASTGASRMLVGGFDYRRVEVEGVTVNCAVAGSGAPLLLLHGYPENHLMWRDVAPVLARDHTVVLADLRGYGDSGKPAPDAAGLVYSKRSMAGDQAGLMRQLGFGPFQLVAHDRGARVAHRLVLDHPDAVTRLAVLDIVPTRHVLGTVTRAMATAYYHWFFLAAANGVPEHMIGADPGYWVRSLTGPLLGEGASIDPQVMADYIRCFGDPGTIAARARTTARRRASTWCMTRRALPPGSGSAVRSWCCGGRRDSSAAVTTRSPSGASTPPTSAATRCPPVTSCPKKRRIRSVPPCATSLTNARATAQHQEHQQWTDPPRSNTRAMRQMRTSAETGLPA
jgi:haloacetate dehalogenase